MYKKHGLSGPQNKRPATYEPAEELLKMRQGGLRPRNAGFGRRPGPNVAMRTEGKQLLERKQEQSRMMRNGQIVAEEAAANKVRRGGQSNTRRNTLQTAQFLPTDNVGTSTRRTAGHTGQRIDQRTGLLNAQRSGINNAARPAQTEYYRNAPRPVPGAAYQNPSQAPQPSHQPQRGPAQQQSRAELVQATLAENQGPPRPQNGAPQAQGPQCTQSTAQHNPLQPAEQSPDPKKPAKPSTPQSNPYIEATKELYQEDLAAWNWLRESPAARARRERQEQNKDTSENIKDLGELFKDFRGKGKDIENKYSVELAKRNLLRDFPKSWPYLRARKEEEEEEEKGKGRDRVGEAEVMLGMGGAGGRFANLSAPTGWRHGDREAEDDSDWHTDVSGDT